MNMNILWGRIKMSTFKDVRWVKAERLQPKNNPWNKGLRTSWDEDARVWHKSAMQGKHRVYLERASLTYDLSLFPYNCSKKDIASMLGISVRTVYRHIKVHTKEAKK